MGHPQTAGSSCPHGIARCRLCAMSRPERSGLSSISVLSGNVWLGVVLNATCYFEELRHGLDGLNGFRRINPTLIREHPFNPCHPCATSAKSTHSATGSKLSYLFLLGER